MSVDETGARAPAGGAALFGKLPCEADYIRINNAGSSAVALSTFLRSNVEQLALSREKPPTAPCRFALLGSEPAVIGQLSASRDAGGRRFPLALFAELPAAALRPEPAACIAVAETFWQACERVSPELAQLKRDAVEQRLAALDAPSPAQLATAIERTRARLSSYSASAFTRKLLACEPPDPASCYALHRLWSASAQGTMIALPIEEADDVAAWLHFYSMTDSRQARSGAAFFWSEPGPSGLLLCPRGPSSRVLLAQTGRAKLGAHLGRVTTHDRRALEAATNALQEPFGGLSAAASVIDMAGTLATTMGT